MVKTNAVIRNNAGIHVRPSGVILGELGTYSGEIVISHDDTTVELNSVMSLLILGLMKDDEIEITVTGNDEENVCSKAKDLFERIYDFPPRD